MLSYEIEILIIFVYNPLLISIFPYMLFLNWCLVMAFIRNQAMQRQRQKILSNP